MLRLNVAANQPLLQSRPLAAAPSEHIAVIGLGYVGLPLGVSFARIFDDVIWI